MAEISLARDQTRVKSGAICMVETGGRQLWGNGTGLPSVPADHLLHVTPATVGYGVNVDDDYKAAFCLDPFLLDPGPGLFCVWQRWSYVVSFVYSCCQDCCVPLRSVHQRSTAPSDQLLPTMNATRTLRQAAVQHRTPLIQFLGKRTTPGKFGVQLPLSTAVGGISLFVILTLGRVHRPRSSGTPSLSIGQPA